MAKAITGRPEIRRKRWQEIGDAFHRLRRSKQAEAAWKIANKKRVPDWPEALLASYEAVIRAQREV